mmetsp:Transcript_49079/g.158507  ORF Transcript_49079/g.158507 Transcript_49079/m.158507 type:complete len:253 (+) Transcript_49079:614-1372(+)
MSSASTSAATSTSQSTGASTSPSAKPSNSRSSRMSATSTSPPTLSWARSASRVRPATKMVSPSPTSPSADSLSPSSSSSSSPATASSSEPRAVPPGSHSGTLSSGRDSAPADDKALCTKLPTSFSSRGQLLCSMPLKSSKVTDLAVASSAASLKTFRAALAQSIPTMSSRVPWHSRNGRPACRFCVNAARARRVNQPDNAMQPANLCSYVKTLSTATAAPCEKPQTNTLAGGTPSSRSNRAISAWTARTDAA